jgi:hypothetical protein
MDQRCVARSHPHLMHDDVAARLVGCRSAHPTWGPHKLMAYFERRHPQLAWPAASSLGALPEGDGLVRARRRGTDAYRVISAALLVGGHTPAREEAQLDTSLANRTPMPESRA